MTCRVVLVEDQPGTRTLLQELLDELGGFSVVCAASGEGQAKVWLEDHPGAWDLAIVDLLLADGSGLGVLASARRTHPAGAVLVLTGFAGGAIGTRCLSLGATAVFDKADTAPFLRWLAQFGASAVACSSNGCTG